jgi:hypothetical protein
VLSQINPVCTTPSYLSKIILNIILPPTSRSSYVCVYIYIFVLHAVPLSCPSHPSAVHHSNYTWRRVQVMKLLIMQFCPTSLHFTPLFSQTILLSTQVSNTLSLCPTLNVRNQVSHPHKTADNIIVLYILIYAFLVSRQ